MTCGYVSLAYETASGTQPLFPNDPPASCTLLSVRLAAGTDSTDQPRRCADPDALLDYLAGPEGRKITGSYTFSDSALRLEVLYEGTEHSCRVVLADNFLIGRPRSTFVSQEEVYLVSGGVDWNYLERLLLPETPGA